MPAKAETLVDESVPLPKRRAKKVGFKRITPEAAKAVTKKMKAKTDKPKAPGKISFKSVHVDSAKITPAADLKTKRYWVGAITSAPFETRHAFGVSFTKWTGVVEADPRTGNLILDGAKRGTIVELTEEQVRQVKDAIARKIVRTTGNREDATGNYRCDTHNVLASGFRSTPKDTPLGRYLYMVEIDELMPHGWRDTADVPVMDQG